jgi:hypothetical protein
MKCLLVLNGESFRIGPQFSRIRSASSEGINRQKLASYSHIRLINYIKHKFNYDTDVIISSYHFNETCDNMLVEWYKPFLKKCIYFNELFPNENAFHEATNTIIQSFDLSHYTFILFIRIDYYIKKYFLERFTLIDDSVRYAHIDYNGGGVNHAIIYLPQVYYHLLNTPIDTNFRAQATGLNNIKNSVKTDLFIYSYHACSTNLNWNPIYSNVSRGETFYRENKGERYINGEKVLSLEDTEYDHLERTDTLEENLKLIEENRFDIFGYS